MTMHTGLWVVQGLLAFAFGLSGLMKATQPAEKLAKQMAWVNDFAPSTVRLIGIAEVLGAIGLIVPMLVGVLPILTPAAALGLATVMLLAMPVHQRHREPGMRGVNAVLMGMALFVAAGRIMGAGG